MKTHSRKRVKREVYNEEDEDEDDEYIPNSDFEQEAESLRKTDRNAYNNFIETRLEIIKNEPNILKILKEPLLLEDRVNLLQLYEIYKSCEPSTEQWLDLRKKVQNMFEKSKANYTNHCQYTKQQHD